MKALALLFLVGCATEVSDVYHYECSLIQTCDELTLDNGVLVDWYGTLDEIKTMVDEWTNACHILTESEIRNGKCSYILCGARCKPVEGR